MSLNPDLIRARCVEIDTSLSRLEEIARLSRETFQLEDLRAFRTAMANLI